MHYPSRKFLLFGYMFGYMFRYLFTTCRGKNMYKPCLLMYSGWYGHPAEVGVLNTVVLLPHGTRWEVQVARKISPWGCMKRTGILCHWTTTYEMSCALSATPSFSKLQMVGWGYGFCHSQSSKYLHTNSELVSYLHVFARQHQPTHDAEAGGLERLYNPCRGNQRSLCSANSRPSSLSTAIHALKHW